MKQFPGGDTSQLHSERYNFRQKMENGVADVIAVCGVFTLPDTGTETETDKK